MLIEGSISVKACINSNKRDINHIYIDSNKKTKDFNYIRKIIKQNNIDSKEVDRSFFDTLKCGKSHGGIVADVGNRNEDEFVEGDIFFIDGVEDPFNLGYIIRTLYAFGIKNVLLEKKDYSISEPQIIKSSAGAYEMANIKYIDDSSNIIKSYKQYGYTIYALKRGDDAKDIFNEIFNSKALFIIGGEKRGISSALLELCDKYLFIPYGSDFRNSLNAAAAADIVGTLLFAQRKK